MVIAMSSGALPRRTLGELDDPFDLGSLLTKTARR